MAGLGFGRRGRDMDMMRGKTAPSNQRGLGLSSERGSYQTGEYRPGQDDPAFDANPEMGQDDAFGPPGEMIGDDAAQEAPEMGDGWSDDERAFRDEVEADKDGSDDMEAWKRKWLMRGTQDFGLEHEQAMRVLVSIADFDLPEQESEDLYGSGE